MADVLYVAQFHHATGQQAEGPTGSPDRARTAGKGDQMSFLLSVKGTWVSLEGMLALVEGIIQTVVHQAFADADHRVATHLEGLEGLGDLLIGQTRSRSVAIDFQ